MRIEVHAVTIKDVRIEASGDVVEIDHPQLRWDNFLEVFRNFSVTGPKAEISVAVPARSASHWAWSPRAPSCRAS
ncbi:hypothetical protein [Microbacterium aurum]